jgi:hypothetical protein
MSAESLLCPLGESPEIWRARVARLIKRKLIWPEGTRIRNLMLDPDYYPVSARPVLFPRRRFKTSSRF